MPGRISTVVILVLIVVTIFFLLARRASDPAGTPSSRTASRADSIHAEQRSAGTGDALPSKSGSRSPCTKPRTITTASGLQYEILVEGTGPRPGPTDTVQVHYHGTTMDGTVFDSSIDRGTPASFPLNRVIKGWTEGVQLMKTGAKYRFTIPSDLAYGSKGVGDKIGPDETLVFEIALLEITPQP